MEFTGRIKQILPVRSGVSQRTGNEWKALPFIFEYFEHDTDRYADSVVLETYDTKVIDNMKEGLTVKCGFSHKTHEHEGRWFNELRLYKIESVRGTQQPTHPTNGDPSVIAPQPQINAPTGAVNAGGEDDDLPF